MDNEKTQTLNELAERIRDLATTNRVLAEFTTGDLLETWTKIEEALAVEITAYLRAGGKLAD